MSCEWIDESDGERLLKCDFFIRDWRRVVMIFRFFFYSDIPKFCCAGCSVIRSSWMMLLWRSWDVDLLFRCSWDLFIIHSFRATVMKTRPWKTYVCERIMRYVEAILTEWHIFSANFSSKQVSNNVNVERLWVKESEFDCVHAVIMN